MSIKIDFKPTELANKEKLKKQLKKVRSFYNKYFLNVTEDDEDDENNSIKETRNDSEE